MEPVTEFQLASLEMLHISFSELNTTVLNHHPKSIRRHSDAQKRWGGRLGVDCCFMRSAK